MIISVVFILTRFRFFKNLVRHMTSEREKESALQAQKTLRIADQTLGHLRKGMNTNTARAVCDILYSELKPSAVAITNSTQILAHVGIASDHHQMNSPIRTDETKEVIDKGKLMVVHEGTIHCSEPTCPLGAAVIAPLIQREETVGTLKLYYSSGKEITDVTIELITGLSALLSNQLELADADRAVQLAVEAEIKALQAQIHPHFLFNAMNTIISLIRTDPDQARQLLTSLSYFLRQNVTGTTATLVSLAQELSHVKAYLAINEARFIDKLTIVYDVDETVLARSIPPFTLQPLVGNAIHHGIKDMERNSVIQVFIRQKGEDIEIGVSDNGIGMSPERAAMIGVSQLASETGTGVGLFNVNRRLQMTFGVRSSIVVESEPMKGTTISFRIPKGEVESGVENSNDDR